MRDQWTRRRVRLLKRLWASGITAEAIGAQLGGLSRSAVLGKVYRLRRRGRAAGALKARPKRQRSKQIAPPPDAPRTQPKGLLELTNNCCRWPVAQPGARGIFFCGAPGADLAGGVPYCPYHALRAYVIPPKRVAAAKSKNAKSKTARSKTARSKTARSKTAAAEQSAASPARRRYVWRGPVRHPAPRFR